MFEEILPEIQWSELYFTFIKFLLAAIILGLGWIVGHLLGKGISRLLVKLGLEDLLHKTILGKALHRSGITCVKFFEIIIRWIVYLFALLLALEIFQIRMLENLLQTAPEYLPNIIVGLIILFIGLVISDLISDMIKVISAEAKVEFAAIIALTIRLICYYVVLIISLGVMKIDVTVLNTIGNTLSWGISIGIGLGLGIALGFGLKDYVAKNIERWVSSTGEIAKKPEDFWTWYTRKEQEK
jgi:hypothetical protein